MKKLLALTLALLLTLSSALADRLYVFPDSNTRYLTWEEVYEWDYESLGYAFNEIFARRGYVFEPGQKYEYYFSVQPWYTPNRDTNNARAVYPYCTDVEWANYELIKEVRAYKKTWGDSGRSIWDTFSTGFDTLSGFEFIHLRSDQTLPVYSAPSSRSWRGANGKAEVSTNGAIYAAGWEGGWLLVMYETNNGSVRVGYVDANSIRGGVSMDTALSFQYADATVQQRVSLTDDPARAYSTITTLGKGTHVTYLTSFFNSSAWDYVETRVDGKTVRGFIPSGSLDLTGGAELLDDLDSSSYTK